MIKTTKLIAWLAVAVFLLGMSRLMKTKSILVLAIVVLFLVTAWPCESVFADSIIGWGRADFGAATPPAGNDYVAIAGGKHYSLALKSDGSIVGWGDDGGGRATPPAGNDYVAISAGYGHGLALKQDGSIVGWGDNDDGQATPPAGNDYVAIAAGSRHSLALKSDGSIVGWGRDNYGEATPPAGSDYVAITAGGYHSLALKSDGSIVAWGNNYYGQARPPAGIDFVAITGGWGYSLALKTDGSIVGWGGDTYGEATPPSGNDFVAITACVVHSLALKSDGSIVGWGSDSRGMATPPAGNDFVAISAGWHHSLAMVVSEKGISHVDVVSGDDNNAGINKGRAFATIQKGIDMAEDGDTVLVWPGVYVERVSFDGKAITVRSADYPAVIEAPWQDAVSFVAGEGPGSVLSNFVIRESATAVACNNESSPTLKNLTIVDNDFGIAAYESSEPYISNCILWNNRDGDLFGDGTAYSWVEQNVGIDPLFADFGGGDYHLLSEKGRYVPAYGLWSFDERTSPCIDGGDPADDPFGERMPNGGRINIGAYGGTPYASMSEWPIRHDSNRDGRMDFRDLASFCDEWLLEMRWVTPQDLAWVIEPYALSWSSVTMEAIAKDASGVEYLFRNTTLAYDSGWQDEPDWVDTGLDPNTWYCYALEVRDKSPAQNWRMLSGEACVVTIPPETTPPEPAPTWDPNDPYQWPTEIYIGPSPTLGWGFEMTCTVATDASGVVEYWFECYDAPSYNSDWITANTWTTPAMGLQGLNIGFRVKARDAYRNETAWSEVKWPSDAPLRDDTTPPTPDPATWSVEPYALSSTLVYMEAIAAVDDSGVEYNFENITIRGHVSGWQDSRNWTDTALSQETEYCYRVKTRDKSPNANETAWSNTACATTQSGGVR